MASRAFVHSITAGADSHFGLTRGEEVGGSRKGFYIYFIYPMRGVISFSEKREGAIAAKGPSGAVVCYLISPLR